MMTRSGIFCIYTSRTETIRHGIISDLPKNLNLEDGIMAISTLSQGPSKYRIITLSRIERGEFICGRTMYITEEERLVFNTFFKITCGNAESFLRYVEDRPGAADRFLLFPVARKLFDKKVKRILKSQKRRFFKTSRTLNAIKINEIFCTMFRHKYNREIEWR